MQMEKPKTKQNLHVNWLEIQSVWKEDFGTPLWNYVSRTFIFLKVWKKLSKKLILSRKTEKLVEIKLLYFVTAQPLNSFHVWEICPPMSLYEPHTPNPSLTMPINYKQKLFALNFGKNEEKTNISILKDRQGVGSISRSSQRSLTKQFFSVLATIPPPGFPIMPDSNSWFTSLF